MTQENYSVLVDAKQEYNHQIVNILSSGILKGIKSVYYECENMCQQENTPENVLMVFQDKLSKIPKWTLAKIEQEYQLIKKDSACDWINDLLKVIYITHIKILSLVNKVKKKGRLNIKVPTGPQFLHICYVNVAREMWKNPYLCSTHVSRYEQQKNTREMEKIIKDTIMDTLRQQLPVKNIIQDFLDLSEKEDLSLVATPVEHEDLDNPESKTNIELKNTKYMDKLQTIVKDDLKRKHTTQPKSKKIDKFANLEADKVKSVLASSKVEPTIPLDNLEGDLDEINLEDLVSEPQEQSTFQKEEKIIANENTEEPVNNEQKNLDTKDALNPELDNIEINGNNIINSTLENTETELGTSEVIGDTTSPPNYDEIENTIPLEMNTQTEEDKQEHPNADNINKEQQQSLDDLLTENDKKELLVASSFDKPPKNNNKSGITNNKGLELNIDEIDNIDLEFDELSNVDLHEIDHKNKEVMTSSIQPKKKFTFFNDAPVL